MVQLEEPLGIHPMCPHFDRLSAQQSAIDFIIRRSSMQSRHNPHQEMTLCNDTLILSINPECEDVNGVESVDVSLLCFKSKDVSNCHLLTASNIDNRKT